MFPLRTWNLRKLRDQLEVIIALLLAIICGIFGILGSIPVPALEASILTVLALIAYAQIKDRDVRDKLSKRLDELETNVVLDNFFQRDTDEEPLLENAREEIWLVRQTGNFIFDLDPQCLRQFLERNKGGYIRIVLTAPTIAMLNQVALRNNLEITRIQASFNGAQSHLILIGAEIAPLTRRLQVRFAPYPIQMNSVFVDPHHSNADNRRAVIRYISYNKNIDDLRDMLDFTLRGDLGPRVFSYYFEEAKKIFFRSSKVVVLIGSPRSGKTEMIQRLTKSIFEKDRDKLCSILSDQINDGFKITIEYHNGKDYVKTDVLVDQKGKDEITNFNALRDVYTNIAGGKILIVDDVSSYHFKWQEFIDTIKQLVDNPVVTLFLIITLEEKTHPDYKEELRSFVDYIEHHYRTTVLNEEPGNKEQRLQQELEASLLLVKHAPDWGLLPGSHQLSEQ